MTEQYEAIRLLLSRVESLGLDWYRGAKTKAADLFQSRITGSFSIFDGKEIYTIGRKPKGNFPFGKILVMTPSGVEEEELLGLWVRWNFEADPFEFRLFLGQWSEVRGEKTFIAFRFEAPEKGDDHNYYHCQPCRNFGDRVMIPNAALISERFPTIPVDASNIVELTVCALMATMGRQKMKQFVREHLREPAAASNASLKDAYARCCM